VVVDRAPRSLPLIRVDKNVEHCGEEMQNPLLEVGSERIRDAVLWIDWPAVARAGPERELSLKTAGCQLVPRVQVARAGDVLVVGSGDDFTHNPHGWLEDQTTVFNLTLLDSSFSFRRRLGSAGRYRIDCDTHKWMRAHLHLFDHPYFAQTDGEGRAELELPAGRRTLQVWHEVLGTRELEVEVPAGGTVQVTVEYGLADRREPARISPNEGPWALE
jgi:hypothetical protein